MAYLVKAILGAALFFGSVFPLFADGFESGDTAAWSSATP